MINFLDVTARVFQSTLPYGSDGIVGCRGFGYLWISIHAPLRERRNTTLRILRFIIRFQSTLPYGSDHSVNLSSIHTNEFQSTLPYGSDSRGLQRGWELKHFNPRSLTGATMCRKDCCLSISNFNPRSLTGATRTMTAI